MNIHKLTINFKQLSLKYLTSLIDFKPNIHEPFLFFPLTDIYYNTTLPYNIHTHVNLKVSHFNGLHVGSARFSPALPPRASQDGRPLEKLPFISTYILRHIIIEGIFLFLLTDKMNFLYHYGTSTIVKVLKGTVGIAYK